jgi:protease-4
MAGGRVFTGARALELGLVDELGGLGEAIAHAAEKSGVGADSIKLVPEPKGALEGMFAAPEKPSEGEIVRMGGAPSPAADAILATLGDLQLAGLPKPAREAVARVLERIESCSDSTIQLIGPDIRIPLD